MTTHQYADYTPFVASKFLRPLTTPAVETADTHLNETHFAVKSDESPSHRATPVGTTTAAPVNHEQIRATDRPHDEVEVARDRRLMLLSLKFEGNSSIEDDARLLILTQRLRRLVPGATPDAVEALANATTTLEDISGRLAAIKNQFDIR